MAKSNRIYGYKVIDKEQVKTEGGIYDVRTYMSKTGCDGTKFIVVNDDFNIKEYGDNIDDPMEKVVKRLKELSKAEWGPYLYVIVSGSNELRDDASSPFITDASRWSGTAYAHISISMKIEQFELTESNGKKQHRLAGCKDSNRITEGWPKEGLERWDKRSGDMCALIPDTPENREALEHFRDGMRTLLRKLEHVMSPDNIQKALTQAALEKLLPASTAPKKGKK